MTTFKELSGHGRQGGKMRTAGAIVSSIALCAAALINGCGSPRIPEKPIDDAAITKGVKAKLAAAFGPFEDRQVRQFDRGADQQTISYMFVSSVDGVVTLTGEVRGQRAKDKAGEIARSVEQVVRVNNNLSLAPGYSDDAVGGKQ
ncbi:MAG: BON domain-containing protein [Bryobacteraceae bacterium]